MTVIICFLYAFAPNKVIAQTLKNSFYIEVRIPSSVKTVMWITEPTFSPLTDSIIGLKIQNEITKLDSGNQTCLFEGTFNGESPIPLQLAFMKDDHLFYSDIFLVSKGGHRLSVNLDTVSGRLTILDYGSTVPFSALNELLVQYSFEDDIKNNSERLETIAKSSQKYDATALEWLTAMIYFRQGFSTSLIPIISNLDCRLDSKRLCSYLKNRIEAEVFIDADQIFPFEKVSYGISLKDSIKDCDFTLVEFWATWCRPCIELLPEWKKLLSTNAPDKFQVLGIALESSKNPNALNRYLSKYPNPWKDYIDWDGKDSDKLNIRLIPANVLIRKDGTVMAKNITVQEMKAILHPKSIAGDQ